jgi:hypothetical protein
MNISVEELSFVFKLAQASMPAPVPAPAPESAASQEQQVRPEPLPGSGSDLLYIQHAIRALNAICVRSRCDGCPLYLGGHEPCVRNHLISIERRITGRFSKKEDEPCGE